MECCVKNKHQVNIEPVKDEHWRGVLCKKQAPSKRHRIKTTVVCDTLRREINHTCKIFLMGKNSHLNNQI